MIYETTYRKLKSTHEQAVHLKNAPAFEHKRALGKDVQRMRLVPMLVRIYAEQSIVWEGDRVQKEAEKVVSVAMSCMEQDTHKPVQAYYVPGVAHFPAFMKEIFEFVGKTEVVEAQKIKYKED